MVVYGIDEERSFNAVNRWMNQIKEYAPESVKVVLVGNKLDLDKREVSTESGSLIRH